MRYHLISETIDGSIKNIIQLKTLDSSLEYSQMFDALCETPDVFQNKLVQALNSCGENMKCSPLDAFNKVLCASDDGDDDSRKKLYSWWRGVFEVLGKIDVPTDKQDEYNQKIDDLMAEILKSSSDVQLGDDGAEERENDGQMVSEEYENASKEDEQKMLNDMKFAIGKIGEIANKVKNVLNFVNPYCESTNFGDELQKYIDWIRETNHMVEGWSDDDIATLATMLKEFIDDVNGMKGDNALNMLFKFLFDYCFFDTEEDAANWWATSDFNYRKINESKNRGNSNMKKLIKEANDLQKYIDFIYEYDTSEVRDWQEDNIDQMAAEVKELIDNANTQPGAKSVRKLIQYLGDYIFETKRDAAEWWKTSEFNLNRMNESKKGDLEMENDNELYEIRRNYVLGITEYGHTRNSLEKIIDDRYESRKMLSDWHGLQTKFDGLVIDANDGIVSSHEVVRFMIDNDLADTEKEAREFVTEYLDLELDEYDSDDNEWRDLPGGEDLKAMDFGAVKESSKEFKVGDLVNYIDPMEPDYVYKNYEVTEVLPDGNLVISKDSIGEDVFVSQDDVELASGGFFEGKEIKAESIEDFEIGDRVWWNDPDDDISSGEYTITGMMSDYDDDGNKQEIFCLKSDDGSEVEVLEDEIEPLEVHARDEDPDMGASAGGNDDEWVSMDDLVSEQKDDVKAGKKFKVGNNVFWNDELDGEVHKVTAVYGDGTISIDYGKSKFPASDFDPAPDNAMDYDYWESKGNSNDEPKKDDEVKADKKFKGDDGKVKTLDNAENKKVVSEMTIEQEITNCDQLLRLLWGQGRSNLQELLDSGIADDDAILSTIEEYGIRNLTEVNDMMAYDFDSLLESLGADMDVYNDTGDIQST